MIAGLPLIGTVERNRHRMNNDSVADLCGKAVELARQGDIEAADEALAEAARGCGLLQIPLVAFGEAGRVMVASAARELVRERIKRGLPIPRMSEGFDLDNPYAQWDKLHGHRPTVFISYSHSDKRQVASLTRLLKQHRIDVWVDNSEIKFGDSLLQKLGDAIDTVDLVLAVLSNSSIRSEWVRRELEIAINNEINQKRVSVIPILLDSSPLPSFLRGKVYVDFSTAYRRRVNRSRLVDSIKLHCKRNS